MNYGGDLAKLVLTLFPTCYNQQKPAGVLFSFSKWIDVLYSYLY